MYSNIWQHKKIIPKIIATNKYVWNFVLLSSRCVNHKALCAKVVAKPEDNNNKVFVSGSSQISKDCTLLGGQTHPIAIAGAKLTWKKAQKNAKKKRTSETINNAIP